MPGEPDSVAHRHSKRPCRFTPGALAPVRVVLSRSINAQSAPSAPLAGTSRLHCTAAYTRCLRCAGAPRRPASGSVLSPVIPSRHVVVRDPGKLAGCMRPVPSPATLVFPHGGRARHFQRESFRGYLLVRLRYDLPSCLPPLRDLYFRASDGSVTLPAAGYDYGVQLGNLHRWDLHPLE